MLNRAIQVLNFDNSVIKQSGLFSLYKSEIIDLTDLAPRARLWMDDKIKKSVAGRISHLDKQAVTFVGSGDFHHISQLLIERFYEPLSLVIFDFHPDWDTLPPRFGCGSWVTEVLKNKNILKCVLIGVSSSDISTWHIQSGNLSSLKDNRLEIYPYLHRPSYVFFKRVPDNLSLRIKRRMGYQKIYWHQLEKTDLRVFLAPLLERLPAKEVYISIDKDCLKKDYALTNWEEGLFSLEELLLALDFIKEKTKIIGMDIVGDYSSIRVKGRLKAFLSRLDHPGDIAALKFPASSVTAVNELTNLKILQAVTA